MTDEKDLHGEQRKAYMALTMGERYGGTSPLLQNLEGVDGFIMPDYSQIELGILAHIATQPKAYVICQNDYPHSVALVAEQAEAERTRIQMMRDEEHARDAKHGVRYTKSYMHVKEVPVLLPPDLSAHKPLTIESITAIGERMFDLIPKDVWLARTGFSNRHLDSNESESLFLALLLQGIGEHAGDETMSRHGELMLTELDNRWKEEDAEDKRKAYESGGVPLDAE